MLKIAAVVATHNRPRLLANRTLASVELQTRPPDYLVVVDDSGPQMRPTNKEVVAGFGADGVTTVYLENRRTPGLSGANKLWCSKTWTWSQPGSFTTAASTTGECPLKYRTASTRTNFS